MKRTRRGFLGTTVVAGLPVLGVMPVTGQNADGFETIRVPQDASTIQDGVEEAEPGDLVLVDSGTYEETVEVSTPEITIRGTDRNGVVLDGSFDRTNGVLIEADGVALENMTARHFTGNAFYWTDVVGFRGSFLTAYNNGYYGVYAYGSRDGRFEYSYASGHGDAGFYLGRNDPFEAVISNVIAERNAAGYSGTSAGGDLTIERSVWQHNMAGIVPNTLDESDPPQRSCRIRENVVRHNHNEDAPTTDLMYPTFGTGILVWGGNDNLIEDNFVSDHEHFGVVLQSHVDDPSGNEVRRNVVRDSADADLALGVPSGDGNRFADNGFSTAMPADIEEDASAGDEAVAEVFERQQRRADSGDYPSGDWQTQPAPTAQPTMSDPEAPPRPARRSSSWGDR